MSKRTYKAIWENEEDISYSGILKKYDYCRSKRINDKQGGKAQYYDIIRSFIIGDNCYNDEIDLEMMQILNWIALWKTDRIIELNKYPNKKDAGLKILLTKLKDSKGVLNDETEDTIIETLKELLKSCKGIDLPMASTIMRFYNPSLCPIIDRRADRAIFEKWEELRDDFHFVIDNTHNEEVIRFLAKLKGDDWKIQYYIYYVKICHEFVKNNEGTEIESIDKFLYQIDRGLNKKDNPLDTYEIGKWAK